MFEEFEGGNAVEYIAACSVEQVAVVMVDIDHGRIEAVMRTGWRLLEGHTAAVAVDIATTWVS